MDDGWHFNKASQEWWHWQDEEVTLKVTIEAWADYKREALIKLMPDFDRIRSTD